jgi:hypothetical protein
MSIEPEAPSPDRLRAALPAAMKAGAIGNAETVPASSTVDGWLAVERCCPHMCPATVDVDTRGEPSGTAGCRVNTVSRRAERRLISVSVGP